MRAAMHGKAGVMLALVCVLAVALKASAQCPYVSEAEELPDHPRPVEYQGWDGFYNNLAHPEWGVADSNLLRILPPKYADGQYAPSNPDGPNPRSVSEATMAGNTGIIPDIPRTVFWTHYGQQVVEEILDAQRNPCVPEYVNIPLPDGDSLYTNYTQGFIPLPRARFNYRTGWAPSVPREQLTEISAFIDGTLMYGPNKPWADSIRSFEGGRLRSKADGKRARGLAVSSSVEEHLPDTNWLGLPVANPPAPFYGKLQSAARLYLLGNPRTNENPFLLSMGILWFREHNYHADRLAAENPTWTDEELFLEARKWTIAMHQKVTLYEWLPLVVHNSSARYSELVDANGDSAYSGYKDYVNPQISHVFQSAAMRIGHTFVTPGVHRRTASCDFYEETAGDGTKSYPRAIRTCNSYFRPEEFIDEYDNSFEELVMGMTSQLTEREDNIITEDLRGFVFGPLEATRRDLMAINIQRARDHGLPSYNDARIHFGLAPITDFSDLPVSADLVTATREVYGDELEHFDIWTGGLLESEAFDGPGELFSAIILDQFLRIRDGDRFWFENELNGLFTDEERELIFNTTIHDIIVRNSRGVITTDDIPANPFLFQAGDPCPQPEPEPGRQLSQTDLEPCTNPQTYDYFQRSYDIGSLPLTVALGLGGTVVLALGLMIFFVRRGRKQRQLLRETAGTIRQQAASTRRSSHRPGAEAVREGNRAIRDELAELDMPDESVPDDRRHLFKARIRSHGFLSNTNLEVVYVGVIHERDGDQVGASVVVYNRDGEVLQSVPVNDVRAFHTGPLYRSVYLSCQSGVGTSLIFNALNGAKFTVKLEQGLDDSHAPIEAVVHATDDDILEVSARESTAARTRINDAIEYALNGVFANSDPDFRATQRRHGGGQDAGTTDQDHERVLRNLRLSQFEFAGLIGLPSEHEFVISLFNFADFNGDGYLSASEIIQVLKPFSESDPTRRSSLLFDFYDKDHSGMLDLDELREFIISLYALTGLDDLSDEQADTLLKTIFGEHAMQTGVNREQFVSDIAQQPHLQDALDRLLPGAKPKKDRHAAAAADAAAGAEDDDERDDVQERKGWLLRWSDYVAANRLDCFWFMAFMVSTALIFYERFWRYEIVRLHGGLRAITGYGVATTRGGASAMMWTFSLAVLPLCRNTLTFLRGTFVAKVLPLDSAIEFHKLAAKTGFLFVCVHLIGHVINFYNISTQPAADVGCLFRQVFWTSDFLPHFGWWVFQTVTGLSGFLLTLVCIFMFIFSLQIVRRSSFAVFWSVHHLWVLFFALLYLHGAARLVQEPFTYFFATGPLVLLAIDKLISLSRSHHDLNVQEALLLPSGVLCLQMDKPPGFEAMQSGQWLRLKCTAVSKYEWHPFTISSAPQENFVSVHIRSAGPWTTKLRQVFAEAKSTGADLPTVQLEGPFGEIHQDWLNSSVAVFVGGGIGVTPYASILQDLAWRYHNNQNVSLRHIHFIWVTRTQKEYEWMVELIREVQAEIPDDVLTVDVYITQGKRDYDLRTSLMFMFERNHIEGSKVSLLTGLRATTNFQRPNFEKILPALRDQFDPLPISIYTCGPPALANAVENGTRSTNESEATSVPLRHHFVSF
ncbi:dual oxidase 2 short isoform [Salpingoeca rosetta]|uniref:NAD(P)H oxidase (H2O2-forming) n=1 Tax=Salpingoeca rosetta (strain ATCC 50818 / BSB-021) TaxID=946362 RepID=F2UDN9_SALR5|nr:dual oxidase 2 short isoform [Salpingoeca rosetta]EGD74734.1 dual oxidase 2 short isoform [Salpingoeca rosetta]|eukprot:XP_004992991.1 dual oxidase 2 short isoform [Salpingoeca rosetta]